MNLKESAKKLELEEEELLELVDLFLKTTSSELTELQSALEKKGFPVAERMAHSIKGAAGSLGLMDIHDAAKGIEMALRENHLTDINGCILMIREKLDLIAEALKIGDQNAKA
ncbi:MAG: Hpt domain-containing protein [Thermodesulfobacteriota bacterium]|nr:Hpt domain-containing protein [Thermodesulfobacteriota bacterium]